MKEEPLFFHPSSLIPPLVGAVMRRVSRRTVLKGLGAAVALPWLEAMAPLGALATPAPASAPRRLAFLYVPNGVNMAEWKPAAEGALGELPSILKPLEPVKDDLLVLT